MKGSKNLLINNLMGVVKNYALFDVGARERQKKALQRRAFWFRDVILFVLMAV